MTWARSNPATLLIRVMEKEKGVRNRLLTGWRDGVVPRNRKRFLTPFLTRHEAEPLIRGEEQSAPDQQTGKPQRAAAQ